MNNRPFFLGCRCGLGTRLEESVLIPELSSVTSSMGAFLQPLQCYNAYLMTSQAAGHSTVMCSFQESYIQRGQLVVTYLAHKALLLNLIPRPPHPAFVARSTKSGGRHGRTYHMMRAAADVMFSLLTSGFVLSPSLFFP